MDIVGRLKKLGVKFEEGLSQKEFDEIEKKFHIKFPPDLKDLLSIGLPISNSFVNWRSNENHNEIMSRLDWPLEGIIFDIENNDFWYDGWGAKPSTLEEALKKCKAEYLFVPKLIPICSHRYISSEPLEYGNPIMSVYQTDIIYYGENLESYLMVEFGMKKYEEIDFNSIRKISFWSEIIEE